MQKTAKIVAGNEIFTDLGLKVDVQCGRSVVDGGGQSPVSVLGYQLAPNGADETLRHHRRRHRINKKNNERSISAVFSLVK